jgi:hypothetical protein
MPRKPKLMFQICQKVRCGLCMGRTIGGDVNEPYACAARAKFAAPCHFERKRGSPPSTRIRMTNAGDLLVRRAPRSG